MGDEVKLVSYDDCIYTLSGSSIVNKKRPLFEESETADAFYKQRFKSLNDFVVKVISNSNAGFINNYNENSIYTYFKVYKAGASYGYIYNKHSGFKKSYKGIESEFLYREIMAIKDDLLYTYSPAMTLVEKMKLLSSLNQFDKDLLKINRERLLKVKETDNPIIITYKVE